MGLRSEIFAEADRIHPLMLGEVRPHTAWERHTRPGDVAILHYSIASPAFDWVLARADRAAIHYHNITPAELLWEDAPAVALECAAGPPGASAGWRAGWRRRRPTRSSTRGRWSTSASRRRPSSA